MQTVSILFKPVRGAKYYEIFFLEEPVQTVHEKKIIRVKKSPVKKKIETRFKFFQIRAAFSESIKTNWSESYVFNQVDIGYDHSGMKENSDVRYKTILNIQSPYSYQHNQLHVGPETTFDFISTNVTYLLHKIIFYRFRWPTEEGYNYNYSKFDKVFKANTIFKDTEGIYIFEFYSINNYNIKESLNRVKLYVDVKGPVISFKKIGLNYIWKLEDRSKPIRARLYVNDQLEKSLQGEKTIIIPKQYILGRSEELKPKKDDPIRKKVKLFALDPFNNESIWEGDL